MSIMNVEYNKCIYILVQDIRPCIVDLFAMILRIGQLVIRALSDHDNSPGIF